MTTAGVTSICFEHPRSPDTEDAPALSHTILVLAGTTGAGKHTIARELSARIGTSYIDANQEEGVDAVSDPLSHISRLTPSPPAAAQLLPAMLRSADLLRHIRLHRQRCSHSTTSPKPPSKPVPPRVDSRS
ncbi:hypothetical protein EDC01DRAFT_634334 [Geopyxis carbonaria]|nr:hypothetical protein EDC01DRAFT_634334 [Geopyxis carbonaria]